MRTFVGCALVLALAFSATAVAQEKVDGKKLIGKWAPKEDKKGGPAMTLEFMKDGKLALSVDFMGKAEKIDGLKGLSIGPDGRPRAQLSL